MSANEDTTNEAFLSKDEEGIPYIQRGNHILRLDCENLDEHYKERARVELRETPENVEFGLSELKKLIEADEDLYVPLDDDDYLLKFLRPCKYYPESTFRLLTRYYKFIAKNPKYAADLMPSTVEEVYANNIIEFLPLRVKGARVMIVTIDKWKPKKVGVHLLFKAVIMAIEIAMLEPRTQVGGVHVILDLQGLSLSHIFEFSPMLAKTIIDFVQECTAVRLKGIHVVNQSYLFNMGWAIFKPFVGEKLRKRMMFHGKKWDDVMEYIPTDFLPVKYGGSLDIPYAPGSFLVDVLKYYEASYKQNSTYGYNNEKNKISIVDDV